VDHFIITHDIATARPLTEKDRYDIMMAFDKVLAEYPIEFEDWKTTQRTEVREV
jgi:hypothetical protein